MMLRQSHCARPGSQRTLRRRKPDSNLRFPATASFIFRLVACEGWGRRSVVLQVDFSQGGEPFHRAGGPFGPGALRFRALFELFRKPAADAEDLGRRVMPETP